jgi:hypothetical protein
VTAQNRTGPSSSTGTSMGNSVNPTNTTRIRRPIQCVDFIPQYTTTGAAESLANVENRINVWLEMQGSMIELIGINSVVMSHQPVDSHGRLPATWSDVAAAYSMGNPDIYAVHNTIYTTFMRVREVCYYNKSGIVDLNDSQVIPPPYPKPAPPAPAPVTSLGSKATWFWISTVWSLVLPGILTRY